MIGSTEVSIFEVRRSSLIPPFVVPSTYRVEHVLPHLSESRKPTCAT